MAEELLKQTRMERGQIKAALTRFASFINTNFANGGEFTDDDVIQLESRLQKVDPLLGEFSKLQLKIEALDDGEAGNDELDKFETSYFSIISKAKKLIRDSKQTENNTAGANASNSDSNSNIKYPTLELPRYFGDYDKWGQFRDMFTALVHNNVRMENIKKFYYLVSCLKGEAAKVIDSIEITSDNYKIAWDLLKERYENKQITIKNHVKGLFELTAITKESHIAIRKLLDDVQKHIRSLKVLEEPVDKWDTLLIYLVTHKLDILSEKAWEEYIISKKLKSPKFSDLTTFLSERCQLLEAVDHKNTSYNKPVIKNRTYAKTISNIVQNSNTVCEFCKQSHRIYYCEKLKTLPVASRLSEIRQLKLCTNCLRNNHTTAECSAQGCKKCSRKHNTMLHFETTKVDRSTVSENNQVKAEPVESNASNGLLAGHCLDIEPQVLLSTASILIKNAMGYWQRCRALIDSGSMPNFITSNLCKRLKLETTPVNAPVIGVGKTTTNIGQEVRSTIKSVHSDFNTELSFLVIENITDRLPNISFNISKLNIPNHIVLADPDFNVSGEVDILLGAGIFCKLISGGVIKLGEGLPILQATQLGWIVSGSIAAKLNTQSKRPVTCSLAINNNNNNNSEISEQLERFWKIEDCSTSKNISLQDQLCEQNFVKTLQRDESGHFTVSLPIREDAGIIGESFSNALKRLHSMERRFNKNPEFKRKYIEFMNEYEALGHMSRISESEVNNFETKSVFYLPHHGVIKETSTTTNMRVVFDGSCKSTSGVSLNEVLKVGPTLQDDLFSILIRFRKHNFVITADIEKMYRQVYVSEGQRDLQRIVWRKNETDEVQHFKLNTVTYGTASAAYLAIRSLQQVAIEQSDTFPDISEIILHDFYVDDLLTGCDTIENAINLKSDLTNILKKYGFNLRKWEASAKQIIEEAQLDHENSGDYHINDSESKRTLGLVWESHTDVLKYKTVQSNSMENATKRSILSSIATLFDPLGLVAPVTIRAKIILQKLWEKQLDWDSPLPLETHDLWVNYNQQLVFVNEMVQPRHVLIKNATHVELHGFCDSSQVSYGGCIYLKSRDITGNVTVRLLCAKSRVAPLKVQTLPRLELCGAVLLANLYQKVVEAMKLNIDSASFWTDSTIVLAWISAEPSRWKTFVSNRVADIQAKTEIKQWGHVSTKENPADLITRGVDPRDLIQNKLWWNGPTWLTLEHNQKRNKVPHNIIENIPEKRKIKASFLNVTSDVNIFNRYSTLYRLLRVVSFCLRFYNNIRDRDQRKIGELALKEMDNALTILLKISQMDSFSSEISAMQASKPISNKSKILALNPFIDNAGLLRVGGRIGKSDLPYNQKFPIILAPKHALTRLIILNEHHRQLHSGAQTLLASLRERYWPLSGRATVRSVLQKCVTCFRVKPSPISEKMGDLPSARVSINRPFYTTGVDFAGPFNIKDGKLRNRAIIKSYLCIFVCFTTKAVHLEAVSNLSSSAFLNALKRFVARRGLPKIMHSDNGTNFVGANRELKRIVSSLTEFITNAEYSDFFLKNNIEWRFSPAYSPHHGGLWEAAVKRAKYHINRIIGTSSNHLTFEELSTIFSQIEAILNSRPLTPLSMDPNDLGVLTPGHFLIGNSLTSIAQQDVTNRPSNRLKHFELLQQLTQQFWRRWSGEYLCQLQERSKWKQEQANTLQIGSLVVLVNDNAPPLCWKLGRVVELHPGDDGIVRVVTVKTASGTTKRAVQRLALLPIAAADN